jgi:hypothetical protein
LQGACLEMVVRASPRAAWISHTHISFCSSILIIYNRVGSDRAFISSKNSFMEHGP